MEGLKFVMILAICVTVAIVLSIWATERHPRQSKKEKKFKHAVDEGIIDSENFPSSGD